MNFYFIIIFFSAIYLLTINYYLTKFDICLDKVSKNENHKALLTLDNFTPLSGTLYFLPTFLILFYDLESEILIVCSLFFILATDKLIFLVTNSNPLLGDS